MSRYISSAGCNDKVNNRFHLVLLAAKRARQLEDGYACLIEDTNHKSAILALNEITDSKITPDNIGTIGRSTDILPVENTE
jgi:DNA-directed RNA polymerase omega subunit